MGAAMNDCNENGQTLDELIGLLSSDIKIEAESKRMDPLFKNPAEYEAFTNRHNKHTVKKGRLEDYEGDCFLGIDAGSTTTKAAIVGEDGTLLYSFYSGNNGSPLNTVIRAVKEIKDRLPDSARIVRACSTCLLYTS